MNNIFEQKEINKKRECFLGKRYCISYCCQKNPQNKTNVHEYCVCVQKLDRKSVLFSQKLARKNVKKNEKVARKSVYLRTRYKVMLCIRER